MAYPSELPTDLPTQGYIIYRDSAPDLGFDPTAPLAFFPPKDSDELFDALRTKYPLVKTHTERMRDAIIEFLLEERAADLAPVMSADFSPWQPSWPSMSSTATSSSVFSSPEIPDLATPSFGNSPKPVASTVRQSSSSSSTATSCGASPPQMEQMTGVFSVSARNQPKQHVRRKMTEAEKVEYRKRRIVKACDKCSKRKRKCHHNQPQMENLADKLNKVSKSRTTAATKPVREAAYMLLPTDSYMAGADWPDVGDFDMDMPLFDNISSFVDDSLFEPSFEHEDLFAELTQDDHYLAVPSQQSVWDQTVRQRPYVHPSSSHQASPIASGSRLLSQPNLGVNTLDQPGTWQHPVILPQGGQRVSDGFGSVVCDLRANGTGQPHDRVPIDRPIQGVPAGVFGDTLQAGTARTGDTGTVGVVSSPSGSTNLPRHSTGFFNSDNRVRPGLSQAVQQLLTVRRALRALQGGARDSGRQVSLQKTINVLADRQTHLERTPDGLRHSLTHSLRTPELQHYSTGLAVNLQDAGYIQPKTLIGETGVPVALRTNNDRVTLTQSQHVATGDILDSMNSQELSSNLYMLRHRALPRADATATTALRLSRNALRQQHSDMAVHSSINSELQAIDAGVSPVASTHTTNAITTVRRVEVPNCEVASQEVLSNGDAPNLQQTSSVYQVRPSDHVRYRDHHGRAAFITAGILLLCLFYLQTTALPVLPVCAMIAVSVFRAQDVLGSQPVERSAKDSSWLSYNGSSMVSRFSEHLRSSMPRLAMPICI